MSSTRSATDQTKHETGQAIVLIALGFIILLGFTGLVVDVSRIFAQRGQLRRAVDAAGLAAASEFRQNATGAQIKQAAITLIRAHGINDPNVDIETCNLSGTTNNNALCPPAGQPARKFVFVKATAQVPMLFLQIIGIPTVSVAGESTAEAASVDVVLVLDTSESQGYDAPSGLAFTGDPNKGCKPADVGVDNVSACIKACNDDPTRPCYPLQKIKDAAKDFVDRMYPGYDRVAIVSYARNANSDYPLGTDLNAAKTAIDGLRAYDNNGTPCPTLSTAGQRWKCASSNPGGALKRAAYELAGVAVKKREESLWVTVFLSSGGMNSTDPIASSDPDSATWGFCPPKVQGQPLTKDNPPLCRSQQWSVHHQAPTITDPNPSLYDAADYAFDNATYLGKKPTNPNNPDGLSVVIYTIALGQKAVCTTGATYSPGPPVVCGSWDPAYTDVDSGLPNTGELFLRYTAAIGDDGNAATDPCKSSNGNALPSGQQCGNYYFAPTGDDLQRIFLEIAGRIFTRINR